MLPGQSENMDPTQDELAAAAPAAAAATATAGVGPGPSTQTGLLTQEMLMDMMAPILADTVNELLAKRYPAAAPAQPPGSIELQLLAIKSTQLIQVYKDRIGSVADANESRALAVKVQTSMLCDVYQELMEIKAASDAVVSQGHAEPCSAIIAAVRKAIRVVQVQLAHKHVAASKGYTLADHYYREVLPIARDLPTEGVWVKQDLTQPERKTLAHVVDLYDKEKAKDRSKPSTPAPKPEQKPRYDPKPHYGYESKDRKQEYDRRDYPNNKKFRHH